MKFGKGQNLTEYTLPIVLVVIASGAMLFGPNLANTMLGQINNANSGELEGKSIRIKSLGDVNKIPGVVIPQDNEFSNLPGKSYTVTLSNGQTVSLNMADPEAVAEIMGGNGITGNSLSALDQLIEDLRTKDPSDPKIPMLSALSEKGRTIRDLQALIEAKLPPGGFENPEARTHFYDTTTIHYNGEDIPISSIAGKLNWFYNDHPDYNTNHQELAYEANLLFYDGYKPDAGHDPTAPINQFMDQLSAIRNSDLFQDPAMKSLVNEVLAKQIFLSSVQTLFAPTKADVVTLVERTGISSDKLCKVSSAVSCDADSNPSG